VFGRQVKGVSRNPVNDDTGHSRLWEGQNTKVNNRKGGEKGEHPKKKGRVKKKRKLKSFGTGTILQQPTRTARGGSTGGVYRNRVSGGKGEAVLGDTSKGTSKLWNGGIPTNLSSM